MTARRKNYRMAKDRITCCNTCARMHHLETDGWAVCYPAVRFGNSEPVFKYDVCDEYIKVTPKC